MTDREKVIKGLECHYSGCEKPDGTICPYWENDRCSASLISDALTLLKEQEETIDELNGFINGFSRDAVPVVRCKDCKHIGNMYKCPVFYSKEKQSDNWFCADGRKKDGVSESN